MDVKLNLKYDSGTFKILFAKYHDGGTAMQIMSYTEGLQCTPSVCMSETVSEVPPSNYCWLKGWSENEGVPEELERAGVVRLTGETTPAGFAKAQYAEILIPIE